MARRERNWCGTVNNYDIKHINAIVNLQKAGIDFAIFALEIGKEGTPHIQFYIRWINGKTKTQAVNWFSRMTDEKMGDKDNKWSLRSRKGTHYEAASYCTPEHPDKDESNCKVIRIIGNFPDEDDEELGVWASIMKDVTERQMDNWELLLKYPGSLRGSSNAINNIRTEWQRTKLNEWREMSVTWISGPTRIGKTSSILKHYGSKNVYRITNYDHPWDAYRGQDVIIMDEFTNSVGLNEMKNYLDNYIINLPSRYQDKIGTYTKIYVISNDPFAKQYNWASEANYGAWKARFTEIIEAESAEDLLAKLSVLHKCDTMED